MHKLGVIDGLTGALSSCHGHHFWGLSSSSHSHCPSLWYGSPTRYDWSTSKTKMFPTFLRQFYGRDSGLGSFFQLRQAILVKQQRNWSDRCTRNWWWPCFWQVPHTLKYIIEDFFSVSHAWQEERINALNVMAFKTYNFLRLFSVRSQWNSYAVCNFTCIYRSVICWVS